MESRRSTICTVWVESAPGKTWSRAQSLDGQEDGPPAVIRSLLASRYVVFSAVVMLAGWLALFGQRVRYDQSIHSFFADDDPDMAAYQRAAATFGDDNFVFVAYDDPELLTPAGIDRVAELARALAPDRIEAVQRVESLDAMPLLWAVDDALIALDRLPALLRNSALNAAKKGIANLDMKSGALTVGGAVRAAAGNAAALSKLKERLTKHPLFLGTLIDAKGTTTALVARLKKTHEHEVIATVAALRAAADSFAERHGFKRPATVGPPVLLADGMAAIEKDGRRLAAVGMILIGIVTLTAVRSLWWAIVPLLAGWVVWMATEDMLVHFHIKLALSGGPLVAQIIVLTMPAASHLAIHFRDDRRREADPRRAARSTLSSVAAPIAWTAITGAIGYGALVTSAVMPVRQFGVILGTCTLVAAILVMLISPIAMMPPFRLEVPVRYGSHSRGRRRDEPAGPLGLPPSRRDRRRRRRRGAAHLRRPGAAQLRDELHQPLPSRDPGRPRLFHGRIPPGRDRSGRSGRPSEGRPRAREHRPAQAG